MKVAFSFKGEGNLSREDRGHAVSPSFLTFLLEHLLPPLQLVIATRVDPPLPLARLRARDELVEVRADDLRFSFKEATRFLADTMELVLDADQVVQLAERTEGWVAGLQLAALSLRGRADVDRFLARFNGSHRYLVDYLAQDVLRREPEPMQRFLLETSVLERLCAPLCAAVTGSSEAQALLEQAERANLFLVPLDDQRQWYRYHALFAEFLQERLRWISPEQMERLHRRAAAWFEEQGWITEAVQHALAGADYGRAACLVTQSARAFLILGQAATLRTWIQALPEDLVRARPRLCMILGHELSSAGEFEAADGWLRAAEARLRTGESGRADYADAGVGEEEGGFRGTLQEVLALRAGNAALEGNLPLALELVHQAGDQLPSDNPLLRSLVAFDLSSAYYWSGDMGAAGPTLREVSLAGAAAGSLYFELLGLVGVGWVHIVRGELRQAAETLRLVLQRVASQEGQTYSVAGIAHTGLGCVLREWNHLESAEQQLRMGIELITRWNFSALVLLGSFQLARVRQARGDAAGALELIAQADAAMRRISGRWRVAAGSWRGAACQAQLWQQQGNLAAAEHWATTVPLDPDQPFTLLSELEQLALVRVQIAQGRAEDALHALERLLTAAEAAGRGGSVLEIRMLQALAQQCLANTEQAIAQLAQVLARAEPEGYTRFFVDEGPVMEALLRQVLAAQRRKRLAPPRPTLAYLERLLAAFGGSPTPGTHSRAAAPRSPNQNQTLIDLLNERELTVLRLLASGKSTGEIARVLVVAPSTIKWHLKHLYVKLQVHSRTQALARARQLQLLE